MCRMPGMKFGCDCHLILLWPPSYSAVTAILFGCDCHLIRLWPPSYLPTCNSRSSYPCLLPQISSSVLLELLIALLSFHMTLYEHSRWDIIRRDKWTFKYKNYEVMNIKCTLNMNRNILQFYFHRLSRAASTFLVPRSITSSLRNV
jgi:hypothetical protein